MEKFRKHIGNISGPFVSALNLSMKSRMADFGMLWKFSNPCDYPRETLDIKISEIIANEQLVGSEAYAKDRKYFRSLAKTTNHNKALSSPHSASRFRVPSETASQYAFKKTNVA